MGETVEEEYFSHIPESVKERVFITGLGPLCPVGVGVEPLAVHFWQIANYDAHRDQTETDDVPESVTIPEFDLSGYIGTARPYLDRHSECMLVSAATALGWEPEEEEDLDGSRCGVATGTMFGNISSADTFQDVIRAKGLRLASPVLFPHCYANTSNSLLSIEFGLRGYNQNYCGDQLSGATALQMAWETLQNGQADLMLAGGGDVLNDKLRGIFRRGPAAAHRPVGEASSLMVLENEKSMANRGTRPLCEIVAMLSCGTNMTHGMASDACTDQVSERVASLISEALDTAGMWEGDVGAVFLILPWAVNGPIKQAVDVAVSNFSSLPVFPPLRSVGHSWAAGYPLQCTLGTLALNQGQLPCAPALESTSRGVETWREQEAMSMVGDSVIVLGCTQRQMVVTVLRAVK